MRMHASGWEAVLLGNGRRFLWQAQFARDLLEFGRELHATDTRIENPLRGGVRINAAIV